MNSCNIPIHLDEVQHPGQRSISSQRDVASLDSDNAGGESVQMPDEVCA